MKNNKTRFLSRCLALSLLLSLPVALPMASRADFASDMAEPVRLVGAKQFDKAAVALQKIAPQYQDQFALHFMIGLASMGRLNEKSKAADAIKYLQASRASLLKAQKLAQSDEQKKETRDLLKVAEEGLRELGVALEDALADAPQEAQATAPKKPAAAAPAANLAVGPPDLPPALPKLAPLKPTPKTAKGRVVNRAGKPLAGVTVSIYGMSLAGEPTRFSPKTNAQGVFSTPLPDGLYTTGAEVKTTYNNQDYRFEVHPLDGEDDVPQDSRKGIVENYVWRLSGLKPGEVEDGKDLRKYYGSSIIARFADMGSLYAARQGLATRELADFPEGFRIELTFTPSGPMPDGLPGRAFSYSQSYNPDGTIMPYFGAGFDLVDVPVGRYAVRGRLAKPDGTSRDLMLNTGILPFPAPAPALSRTLDFEKNPLADIISPGSIFLYAWPAEGG